MEILHAFGIDWRLLTLQVVNFGVLMLALWAFLYKPLLRLMDERRAKIAQGVKDADAAKEALVSAEGEKTARIAAAAKEADTMLERARKEAALREKQLTDEAEAKAARILSGAEKESEEMRTNALLGAKSELAKLIVLGVEKTLRTK